ncbi:MAG: aspartate kinase [Clostridia bacterium]|nr:aspartate kinase [Clostridia bacterium]
MFSLTNKGESPVQVKVVKFGGSSLADAEHFKQVAAIIHADEARRYVVPSAPGKRFPEDTKVTDLLYACYEQVKRGEDITPVFNQIRDRYYDIINALGLDCSLDDELTFIRGALLHNSGRDYMASRGEYLNGILLAKYLGYDFIDAANVIFFRDDGSFDAEHTNTILSEVLARHPRAVIPGFYGSMPNGTINTFSRGGSDITGSIVARAAEATLYENWTDVSGFLMADPRMVENPKPIEIITYRELRELSYMGATVLHEDAIFPVRFAGIPINIRNTNDPAAPGTMIVSQTDRFDAEHVVTGIAGKKGFSVITIEKDMMNAEIGFGRRALEVLEELNISFEHLPSGIDTMCIILSTQGLAENRERLLNHICAAVNPDSIAVEDGLALIAVVGRGMVRAKGTAARVFRAVADASINIRMIDQGSSELNIILGVDEHDFEHALQAIYSEFVKND